MNYYQQNLILILDQKNMCNKKFDYVDDYKSKVQYLKDHFTRLWTRFNYFLILQSALFGASVLDSKKYHIGIPLFGILLCIFWYFFGVQDRYLVALYRKQIEQAWKKIGEIYPTEISGDYSFIGQTEGFSENNKANEINLNFFQRRFEYFSITRLPVIFPIVIIIVWLFVIIVFLNY